MTVSQIADSPPVSAPSPCILPPAKGQGRKEEGRLYMRNGEKRGQKWSRGTTVSYIEIVLLLIKLDEVGPVDNRPSLKPKNNKHNQNKNKKNNNKT